MNLLKMIRSFRPALSGMRSAFITENNIRIHLLAAFAAVSAGIYFHLPRSEWLWLVAAIGCVLAVEYLNTAIEKLTDIVAPQFNENAGNVKDISAASVLITSITAVIIGAVIFLPYLVK
ncbi:MAG: diacylglycerol kinase family protein [Chitinophagales bacterium]|nr:diacylglycerol kinase family protein [Chitinophagales bacterium]